MSTLTLIRVLNPRTPHLLEELASASERFLAELPSRPDAATPVTQIGDPVLDGFEALEVGVGQLSERHRLVLGLRFGLDEQPPMKLEECGFQLAVTRERVRQIEGKAISAVGKFRRRINPAVDYLNVCRQTIGLSWRDPRLVPAVSAMCRTDVRPYLRYVPLLTAMFDLRGADDDSVSDFEEAVASVLSGSHPRSLDELADEVCELLDTEQLRRLPAFSVRRRIELLGPAIRNADGLYELPPTPIEGLNDRKMRRLQTMRRVLERIGPSHFSVVKRELDVLLPPDYQMSERDVHSWLARYAGIFVWAGRGTYGLKSQDVGIRAEQQATALATVTISRSSRRKGIGDEIAAYLAERGPSPLEEIESHILARFSVLKTSILAAIKQDRTKRFTVDESQTVSLRSWADG
jgi:hypothetical protein